MSKQTYIKPFELVDDGGNVKVLYKGRDGKKREFILQPPVDVDYGEFRLSDNIVALAKEVKATSRKFSSDGVQVPLTMSTLRSAYAEPEASAASSSAVIVSISPAHTAAFNAGDLILVQGNNGYESDGITLSQQQLVLYVCEVGSENLVVKALNGKKIGNVSGCLPSLSRGAVLLRLGKASSIEDAISTGYNFETLGAKSQQCQRFTAFIPEDSSSVNGVITDQTVFNELEKRYFDEFILSRDRSYLYSAVGEFENIDGETLLTCRGIWAECRKEFPYGDYGFVEGSIVDFMRDLFSGDKSESRYKVALCGRLLFGSLLKAHYDSCNFSCEHLDVNGVAFLKITSPYGTLFACESDIFNIEEDSGIVLDPAHLERHVYQPLRGDFVDYVDSDENRVRGLLLSEESTLVLANPESFSRIILC